jgi:hypothetical protein
MPNILYPPPRPQSVGEILDSAFRIFRATLLTCLPYAVIAVIATQLPNIYYLAIGRPVLQAAMRMQLRDPVWWVLYILGYVIAIALWNAVVLRQYAIATGRAVATGAELATGLRRIPGVLLCLLAIGVWWAPAFALEGAARVWALLLLIPACYVGVALSCAWTVLLVTGKGAVASMGQSWRLTSGSWWRLTLIYSVAVVLLLVLYVLSGLIAGVLAVLLAHGDIAVITAATTVLVIILSAVGTPFYWALALAVLGDLTVRREGADLAQRLSAPATP